MNSDLQKAREQLATLLPRLRRFARTLTRHAQDADDLVQIALERGIARLDQWRPDTRLTSWMFGIVKNAWIDELRARGRRTALFAPEEAAENIGADTSATHVEMLSVQAAMERLPAEQRLVVALVLIEGLSYKEAAEVLEVPIGTVTSRLARGRAALETLLAPGGSDR